METVSVPAASLDQTHMKTSAPILIAGLLFVAASFTIQAADTPAPLVWNAETKLLDADFQNLPLSAVMRHFQTTTGVEVQMPPGVDKQISAKFNGLSMGDALGRFLAGLSYYGTFDGGNYQVRILDPNGGTNGVAAKSTPPTRSLTSIPRPPSVPATTTQGSGPVIVGKKGSDGKSAGRNLSDADRRALEELMRASGRDGSRDGDRSRSFSTPGTSRPSPDSFRKDRPR